MKKYFLVVISLITIATVQAQDLLDSFIKLLTDVKAAKEIVIKDSKEVKDIFVATTDSLYNYYQNDSIKIINLIKDIKQ